MKVVWFLVVLLLGAVFSNNARAQGALTNGWTHSGSVSPIGDSDSWTFSANVGDQIVIRIGEVTQSGSFTPRIRLLNPGAVQIVIGSGALVAEISVTATNSGTFTAVVDDAVGTSATGTYIITLAKIPGAVFVAPADQGGPMTNGVHHTGTILTGDLDVWTFDALAGEAIVVRAGEITDTNTFTPWVRLYSPSGALLDSGFGAAVGEAAVTASSNGTYVVVMGDGNASRTGSGDYRLTLAKTGNPVVVSAGDEGGTLTNGVHHTATILVGDLDVWSFTAIAGEAIVVRAGEITDTNTFMPWVRLYSPSGTLLSSSFGAVAGEAIATASSNGTFTIVVSDGNGAFSGLGNYRLTLAKTADPVVVSASDEGGPMTNGVQHAGTILTGDLDLWTFAANSGDRLVVRAGEISDTNTFTPWVRLYSPSGTLLSSGFGSFAGEATAAASTSGIFLVVVSDANGALSGSGNYRLTLAKTGDPVVISGGDEGGPMTDGAMHTGIISTGDLDVWTIAANVGDAIVVRAGEITDTNTFTPWVRLYSPSGTLLDSGSGSLVGEATATASSNGMYIVVVGDGNNSISGSGNYRLTLAKTGDAIVVSGGDEGGLLTNGLQHVGTILTGDLDVWTFSANSGDSIIVRAGEITDTNTFTPWVRLYSPSGALLDSGFGSFAAEAAITAANSGTFLIVVGDGNGGLNGSGNYRLTLARSRVAVSVSGGDEGGSMTGGINPEGTITTGDMDIYAFALCKGEGIHLKLDELTETGVFVPWLRLYGPNGNLLGSSFGATSAQINTAAVFGGSFIVVVADGNGSISGTGTYRLTVNGLTDGLKLCTPIIAGATAELGGVGGIDSATFRLFTTTNLATSLNLWTPILTNQFNSFGAFTHTNLFHFSERERYFHLLME